MNPFITKQFVTLNLLHSAVCYTISLSLSFTPLSQIIFDAAFLPSLFFIYSSIPPTILLSKIPNALYCLQCATCFRGAIELLLWYVTRLALTISIVPNKNNPSWCSVSKSPHFHFILIFLSPTLKCFCKCSTLVWYKFLSEIGKEFWALVQP